MSYEIYTDCNYTSLLLKDLSHLTELQAQSDVMSWLIFHVIQVCAREAVQSINKVLGCFSPLSICTVQSPLKYLSESEQITSL